MQAGLDAANALKEAVYIEMCMCESQQVPAAPLMHHASNNCHASLSRCNLAGAAHVRLSACTLGMVHGSKRGMPRYGRHACIQPCVHTVKGHSTFSGLPCQSRRCWRAMPSWTAR